MADPYGYTPPADASPQPPPPLGQAAVAILSALKVDGGESATTESDFDVIVDFGESV